MLTQCHGSNFFDDRAYAAAHQHAHKWEAAYRAAFPTLLHTHIVTADGWAQRGGVDRVLVLASGRTLTVDEKVRKPHALNGRDIVLEATHKYFDSGRCVPGWINKDLACDFIAYTWEDRKDVYIWPFHNLRAAWETNKATWSKTYPWLKTNNRTFRTFSVAIPVDVLIKAIADTMTIKISETESNVRENF